MSNIEQSGTLKGSITPSVNLTGVITPEVVLKGSVAIPTKEPVLIGGNLPKIGEVTLLASAWVGEDNLYHQVVEIEGVTENSQVDLTPDVQQLAIFYNKDLAFVTENEGGVVTVYAIGQKPINDYTIQVTITEVAL